MLLFEVHLFRPMTSLNSCARQYFVLHAHVWLLTGIIYSLQTSPRAIELALAEATPRHG
jgi:hypothetical protein